MVSRLTRIKTEIKTVKIIVLLTLIVTLLSTISGCIQQEETSENNNTNNTLPINEINENSTIYVGRTHADYSTIQRAINAATNGATIIIKNGSYNELIVINKTITLIGEDKNTTIIHFNPDYQMSQVPILNISANNCSIENLQITLSNNSGSSIGILLINSKFNTIENNIITNVAEGIYSFNSKYNTIENNIITNVTNGIKIVSSESNTIINNEIKNNQIGIMTSRSMNNVISHNIFSNNTRYNIILQTSSDDNNISFNIISNSPYGIYIQASQLNNVYKNCVQNNQIGLYPCCGTQLNYFYNNTLINNSAKNAGEKTGLNIWYNNQTGTGNYWDDYNGSDKNQDGIGDTPYMIDGSVNQDIYPLMIPPIDAPCNQ